MQNHFSFSRFNRLFKKYAIEHYKEYLMSVAVLIGILSLLMGVDAYFSKAPLGEANQSIHYMLGFIGTGTIFTSMIFSDLSDKNTALLL
jgi:hypothetical protein